MVSASAMITSDLGSDCAGCTAAVGCAAAVGCVVAVGGGAVVATVSDSESEDEPHATPNAARKTRIKSSRMFFTLRCDKNRGCAPKDGSTTPVWMKDHLFPMGGI